MAPRLGMRSRLALPPKSEQSTSPGSVGSYSVTTRSTTRSPYPSPYPSGHDLPGLAAAQSQAAEQNIDEILDIWETTWFGTPCNSWTARSGVQKWVPPLHHDPEQVDVPDALAVAGHHHGMSYNPAPIILQQQPPQLGPAGMYASYYEQAVAGQHSNGLSPKRQALQQQQQPGGGSGHPSPNRPPASPHHSTAAGAHASFATGYLNNLAALSAAPAAANSAGGGALVAGGLLAYGAPPAVEDALEPCPLQDLQQPSFSQILEEVTHLQQHELQQQQQQQQHEGLKQPRLSTASSCDGGCDSPFTSTLGTWTKRQYLLLPMPPSPAAQRQRQEQEQDQQQQQQQQQQGDASGQKRTSPEAACAQPIPGSLANGGLGNGSRYGNGNTAAAQGGRPAAAAAAGAGAGGGGRGGGSRPQGGSIPEEECTFDEDAVAAAAWRFRMARRWQTEQQRPPDPAHSVSDGADEALQYMHACGVNWNLARTGSTEPQLAGTGDGTRGGLATMGTLDGSFLGLELLASEDGLSSSRAGSQGLLARGGLSREASFHATIGGPRGSAQGATALQEVAKISKRVAELAAAQGAIEAQVTQRWERVQGASSNGDAWVGGLLPGVVVDDWGEFNFILVRVRGLGGRQRMLVRGGNYASRAQLVEALTRQMMQRCAAQGVQPEPLEVMGGGIMEWRRDRDRHLFIRQGYADLASGMSGKEVMNLAAVLTKQSLALGYKVSVDGGRDF